MVEINASYTIIDDAWLWRADHEVGGAQVSGGRNYVESGLVVNSANVTAYGLMSEHTLGDLV